MILIVTNRFDPTTDLVIAEMHKRGIEFLRFNTEEFPTEVTCSIDIDNSKVIHADLDLGHNRRIEVSRVRSIYYRRPKPSRIDPKITAIESRKFALSESQAAMDGLWMTIQCLWVNHPRYIRAAEFKINQLNIAAKLGFEIPRSLVTNDPERAKGFFRSCNGQIVAKVLKTGMIEYKNEVRLIYTNKILETHLDDLQSVKYAPCLFQEYIPKKIEVRSTVVGNHVFSAEIHSQNSSRSRDDWRRYDFDNTPYLPHKLPIEIKQKCVRIIKNQNLYFGAIDLILTPEGRYVFLEANPNGQWGWIEELTQQPICSAIVDLLVQGGKTPH